MLRHENMANLLPRLLRAASRRLRGKIYVLSRAVNMEGGRRILLGSGFRMVGSKFIVLSDGCAFGLNARVEAHAVSGQPSLYVGENSTFGDYCHIGATGSVRIGRSVLGGSNILIIDHNHGSVSEYLNAKISSVPRSRPIVSTGDIYISDNVWIADHVVVLGGTVVGEGSIIAAGAVVKGRYPPFSLIK